jgi:hypothetical protein
MMQVSFYPPFCSMAEFPLLGNLSNLLCGLRSKAFFKNISTQKAYLPFRHAVEKSVAKGLSAFSPTDATLFHF